MRLLETHIEVADVKKSLDLYSKLIPHKAISTWANGDVSALILEDGSVFVVWKTGTLGIYKGRGAAHSHFAFQIKPEEYNHYFSLIESCGLEPLEHIWDTGDKSVYFFDFDGHQGEFITADWIKLEKL